MFFLGFFLITAVESQTKAPLFIHENASIGSIALLTCKINSTQVSDLKWLKFDKQLFNSTKYVINKLEKNYEQLFIKDVKATDQGQYSCIGNDRCDFMLTVLEDFKPNIFDIPDYYLRLNQSIDIMCLYNARPDVFSLIWSKKDGVVNNDKERGKLKITNMKTSDAGVYTCKAENKIGFSEKSFTLEVANDIKWLQKPQSDSVSAGEIFNWTASIVSIDDRVNFVWLKDGNIVDKSFYEQTFVGAKYTSQYLFKKVNIADSGDYKIVVENMVVSGLTHDMNLKVFAAPHVEIEEGKELRIKEGTTVNLTCIVTAYPNPNISWARNNTEISTNKKPKAFKESWRFKHPISLSNINDMETYICASSNDKGTASASIIIHVDKKPVKKAHTETAIIVVSVIIILIIIFVVIFYMKYKDKFFIHKPVAANGQFYTDLVHEEKLVSNLHELENNPNSIKKNINISIKHKQRTASLSAKKRDEHNVSIKLLSSNKRDQQPAAENHNTRLGSLICQGKAVEFKHIMFDEILGSGEYGHVSGGRIIDEDDSSIYKNVSIKMLHENSSAETYRDMLNELRMMRRVSRHPNVVSLIGWCITDENLYVLEEYTPFGSLLTFLRTQRLLGLRQESLEDLPTEDRIDEKTLLSFAWQIASGMKHLASLQIVHRDLACRNVYLGHEKLCKISEYGLTRDIYAENVYRKNTGGQLPVRWMAYETIFEGLYTEKSDVWSFGILLWELVTLGKIPYPGVIRTEQLLDELEAGYHMENPGHISTDLYLMMNSCWKNTPESRPTFSVLVKQLATIMNDTNEVHIDLNRLFNMELEDVLQAEDEILSAPASDCRNISPFNSAPTEQSSSAVA